MKEQRKVTPAPTVERITPAPEDVFGERGSKLPAGWEKLNFNRVLVRNQGVFSAFMPFLAKTVSKSTLPEDDRQILILRTCALTGEVYEATHHILISKAAGVSEDTVEAAKTADPDRLSERGMLLCKTVEELVNDFCISDATWTELAKVYSDEDIIEIVSLVGSYIVMAMYTRSFGVQLEGEELFHSFESIRPYK